MKWLNIDIDKDFRESLALWELSSYKRPHDHPAFLRTMQLPGQIPMSLIFDYSDEARVYYSFYIVSLNNLPYFKSINKPVSHIVSTYGYGGAIYEGPKELKQKVSEKYETLFIKQLIDRGVVSEFVREDLFQEKLTLRKCGSQIKQQSNVVVDLEISMEDRWYVYKHKVRKNVKKARESGLRVVFDKTGRYLCDFLNVYYNTLKRTNAVDSFYIKEEKFRYLNNYFGEANASLFVHVFDNDQVVSTELLLLSPDTIYSFLGGTLSSHFDKRPNDLLKHEVIQWGMESGYRHYILGGGALPNDGVFRYKESFEPNGARTFYVRKVIHNEAVCDILYQERQRYEKLQSNDWHPRCDFFPSYLA